MPTSTDLVTDLPADFEVFGQAVDTALAELKGGTTGQVLSKTSNTNMDFTWVTTDDTNAIQNAIVDAKGDLIAASAADTPARLAVGTNGLVLEAASGETTGLKWGFKGIVQVINATTATTATNATSTYADTNLTATITPKSASNKVFVLISQMAAKNSTNAGSGCWLKLLRDGSLVNEFGNYLGYTNTLINNSVCASFNYLDSPATTSAVTYKTQFKNNVNASGVSVNEGTSSITLVEVSV
jgi:hypothetical protein